MSVQGTSFIAIFSGFLERIKSLVYAISIIGKRHQHQEPVSRPTGGGGWTSQVAVSGSVAL